MARQDSKSKYDAAMRTQRIIFRYLDTLRVLEYEYQIAKAQRIAADRHRSSTVEAFKMKEIRYWIQMARRTERLHNRDSDKPVNIFDNEVFDSDSYPVSKGIIEKYYANLIRIRNSKRTASHNIKHSEKIAELVEELKPLTKAMTSEQIIASQDKERYDYDAEMRKLVENATKKENNNEM